MQPNTTTLSQSPAGEITRTASADAAGRYAWWLCVASFAVLAAAPSAAADTDDAFVAAMRAYDAGRYAFAYGRLAALADAGHPEAARVALMMLRFGPRLYGSEWSASTGQIDRWLAAATKYSVLNNAA